MSELNQDNSREELREQLANHYLKALPAKLHVLLEKREQLYQRQHAMHEDKRLYLLLSHFDQYPQIVAPAQELIHDPIQFTHKKRLLSELERLLEGNEMGTSLKLIYEKLSFNDAIIQNPALEKDLLSLQRLLHTLHGSGATFGFDSITNLSALAENSSEPEFYLHLTRLIDEIQRLLQQEHGSDHPVLVVEDDPDQSYWLQSEFTRLGVSSECAKNGREALNKLGNKPYSLLLLDIVLPDTDGRDLLVEIKQHYEWDLPIIAYSAQGIDLRSECLALGADLYIEKPFNSDVLLSSIYELKQAKKEQEANQNDFLTGLPGRGMFHSHFHHVMALAQREKQACSLVILDIDHFKQVNDTYGHLNGDRVLQKIAQDIQGLLRQSDFIARWGGEEFIILLPNTDLESARHVVEKLRQKISNQDFILDNKHIKVSFSAGIAEAVEKRSIEELTNEADKALYLAKKRGRNRIETSKNLPEDLDRHQDKIRLMIVDDDPLITSILTSYFQNTNFQVAVVDLKLDLYAQIMTYVPDILLLDVMMPRHNGFDILQDLKPEPLLKKTAFVMLTSLAQESDIVKGFHLGADEYIVKPFSIAELEARLLRLAKSRKT